MHFYQKIDIWGLRKEYVLIWEWIHFSKSWTPDRDSFWYAQEQEVRVLKEYEWLKFMHKEVRQLGDPCMSILYPLYERRKARPEVKYDIP